MKKAMAYRILIYISGLLLLALGIILNTKAGLGVSPIISVAYSISVIWEKNFGNMTLFWYSSFILVEMVLHTIMHMRRKKRNEEAKKLKFRFLLDVLQFPLSLIFTRFLNLFSGLFPDYATQCAGTFWGGYVGRLLILLLAIVLTGVGSAMSLDVRLIPNPGDGIVQAIADFIGKSVGLTKNCFDLLCITLTILLGLSLRGKLIGVGIGTVLAVIGVGRVVALFNYLCLEKMNAACDME